MTVTQAKNYLKNIQLLYHSKVLEEKENAPKKEHLSNYVGLLGFEPRRTESKSVVLPLHYNPIFLLNNLLKERKNKITCQNSQNDLLFMVKYSEIGYQ